MKRFASIVLSAALIAGTLAAISTPAQAGCMNTTKGVKCWK